MALWEWFRKVIEPEPPSYAHLGGPPPSPAAALCAPALRTAAEPPSQPAEAVGGREEGREAEKDSHSSSGEHLSKPQTGQPVAPVAARQPGETPQAEQDGERDVPPAATPSEAEESASALRSALHFDSQTFVLGGVQFDVDARYVLKAIVGKGAYGIVASADDWLAATRANGEGGSPAEPSVGSASNAGSVAVKKIFDPFHDRTDCKRLLREIRLLRVLRHPNVLHLLDMLPPTSLRAASWKDVYLITKLYDTNLHRVIYSGQPLSDEHIQYILWQALRALRYMHRAGVVHRDMKPTNILLNRDCELALADLGLARYIGRPGNLGQGGGRNSDEYISAHGEEGEGSPPEADIDEITGRAEAAGAVGSGAGLGSLTKYVVTRWYRAPELLVQNQRYDASVDMWSLGCIVGELLGARALFPGRDSLHQLKLIVERLGAPTKDELAQVENEQAVRYVASLRSRQPPAQHGRAAFGALFPAASPLLLDLVSSLLQFDPRKRPTAEEALAHPYLAAYRDAPEDTAEVPSIEMDFEGQGASKEELRELVWREMCLVRQPGMAVPPA